MNLYDIQFKYFMPTKLVMGKDCITKNSELFKSLGKKAMLVTGAQSAKKNGSEKDVIVALESVGISYLVYDQVVSNPTISCVYEGARLARENQVDFIIAIGGGSPMDAGKAIALLAVQDIPKENLFSGPVTDKILPLALVPTTAGTGSEVTQYSILTNDRAMTKTSIASDLLFPDIAFLDAKYTENLPVITTINTAIDALSHAVESMLSVRSSLFSDSLAMESIRLIMNCLPELKTALEAESEVRISRHTREQLLLASCIAGMVIAQTGTTIVHSMGYSLTYFKDIDHGRANGLLLSEYLRFVEKVEPDLADRILKAMNLADVRTFEKLINNLLGGKEEFTREELNNYSKIAIKAKNIGNCIVQPTEEDICEMFKQALLNM